MKIWFRGIYEVELKENQTKITNILLGETFFDVSYFVPDIDCVIRAIQKYEHERED